MICCNLCRLKIESGLHFFKNAIEEKAPYSIEYRLIFSHNRAKFIKADGKTCHDKKGKALRSIGTFQDITKQKLNEAQLLQYDKIFNSLAEGVIITDAEQNIVAVNPTFTDITGYKKEEAIGKKPSLLQSGKHDKDFYQNMWHQLNTQGKWEGEIWNRKKTGEIFPELMAISCFKDANDNIINYTAVFTDITVIKDKEEELHFLAHHDALTKLPNRILLNERLSQALKKMKRSNLNIAVLFIDIDRFKEINDSFGHPIGDKLLIEVAYRLNKILREEDTIARVSGDEFVVLFENIHNSTEVTYIAQNILEQFSKPFSIENNVITVTASIGITMSPDDGLESNELLRNADIALYRVKEQGRNGLEFFSEELAQSSLLIMNMRNALHQAIADDEFIVYYQPQVNTLTGKITGTEALVRWQSKEMGLVQPNNFIPLAEESGLIVPIGKSVLRQACRQMKTWLEMSTGLEHIAVNLSAKQIASKTLIEDIKQILNETQLQAHYLELEVTETTIILNQEYIKTFKTLQDLGIKISIDDFGTGHSSLTRLKKLPITKLKIDRSFIQGVTDDEDDKVIVKTVIGLAKNLGLMVIAEGVEEPSQVQFLKNHGCEMMQGYYFSKPVLPNKLDISGHS